MGFFEIPVSDLCLSFAPIQSEDRKEGGEPPDPLSDRLEGGKRFRMDGRGSGLEKRKTGEGKKDLSPSRLLSPL